MTTETNHASSSVRTALLAALRFAVRHDLRGAYWLHRNVYAKWMDLSAVPVFAHSDKPIFVDMRVRLHHSFSRSRAELCALDAGLAQVTRRCIEPGMTVLDVGANIGLVTDLLADAVGVDGMVIAFEPNSLLTAGLQKTFDRRANVRLRFLGLADQAAQLPFYIPVDDSMAGLTDWKETSTKTTIEVAKLDDLLATGAIPTPQFMKVDVEGEEWRVFQGAERLLNNEAAPILYFELLADELARRGLRRTAPLDVLSGYSRARYSFFTRSDAGEWKPFDGHGSAWENVLAIPAQRSGCLRALGMTA